MAPYYLPYYMPPYYLCQELLLSDFFSSQFLAVLSLDAVDNLINLYKRVYGLPTLYGFPSS
jgi:hypothetical protein